LDEKAAVLDGLPACNPVLPAILTMGIGKELTEADLRQIHVADDINAETVFVQHRRRPPAQALEPSPLKNCSTSAKSIVLL
jgi:hypothetical protein